MVHVSIFSKILTFSFNLAIIKRYGFVKANLNSRHNLDNFYEDVFYSLRFQNIQQLPLWMKV